MEKILAFFIPSLFSSLSGGGVTYKAYPKPFRIPKISCFF
ncbi:hypothetical protein HPSAT_02945 [Helicobacter pylori Sat464]|nr:hypothetical protein HPSAT_02945 [Helicobacter pylori Sat464]